MKFWQLAFGVTVALTAAAPGYAQQVGFADVAVVSQTMGINDGRICTGEFSRGDIGCTVNAPYVSRTSGWMGVGTMAPSTTLHVSGTIRMADGGETCDANRAGAVKWNGTEFQVCFGSGGWATLASAAVSSTGGTLADRLVSGSSMAILSPNGDILTNGRLNIVTGTSVVAVGNGAADGNTGSYLTAVGQYAAQTTPGSNITAIGYAALQYNSGTNVNAFGSYAARYNTGGGLTAVGHGAAQYNVSNNVTVIGHNSGRNNSGTQVTLVGHTSGMSNSGAQVTGMGYESARNNTGARLTAVGYYAGRDNIFDNVTTLGYNAQSDKANQIVLGDRNIVEVSTTGRFLAKGVSTTGGISATYFQGDGSLLTNLPAGSNDRIVSGTSGITVQMGGVISITTNGVTANYFNTSGQLITPGVGVGVATPSATVHVSGTMMAKTAANDNVCGTTEAGAIRYNSVTKRLQICREPGI